MEFLRASTQPEAVLPRLLNPNPLGFTTYRPGFEGYFERIPRMDPTRPYPTEEVEQTRRVLGELAMAVLEREDAMDLPQVEDGKFGRVVLGLEDPSEGEDRVLVPGTEVIIALWGRGFKTPVHGHKVGYLHEALVKGSIDISMYERLRSGRLDARFALFDRTVQQREPGIFCSAFTQDVGQLERSAVIHNFAALEPTMTLHYLPEHIRDARGNKFEVVGKKNDREFEVDESNVQRMQLEDFIASNVGDVYLVRSPSVPQYGDHYVLIVGGIVQKPHGMRPDDVLFSAGSGTPLKSYGKDELVIFKLSGAARNAFYEHYAIEQRYRSNA